MGRMAGSCTGSHVLVSCAATGHVVALHVRRCLATAQPATHFNRCFRTRWIAVCMLGAPSTPSDVWALAFVQHLIVIVAQVMHLSLFSKCCSAQCNAVAWPLNHIVRVQWTDLEKYKEMHNMIAAGLQSLPTVLLNSVSFALSNNPSHGIFLSEGLFAAAVDVSCLAVMKSNAVLLWQAHRKHTTPMRLLIELVTGRTLSLVLFTVGQLQFIDTSPSFEVAI